jgi:hypothetical protein
MGKRKKDNLRPCFSDQFPVECQHFGLVLPAAQRELGMNLFEGNAAVPRVIRNAAEKERLGVGESGVGKQQTRQFSACISAYASHSGAYRCLRLPAV